jgi:hypothetical protein
MKFNRNIPNNENNNDTDVISNSLLVMLPEIAKRIIEVRTENENFIKNPDDPKEHVINWHQFGIITHTKVVLNTYTKDIHNFIEDWNVNDKITSKLSFKIGNKTKYDLIKIGIVLHDIGKFSRNFRNENGKTDHNFYGHEAISEKLIISEDSFIHDLLKNDFRLTIPQIQYIGRIAGLHFELGKSRDAARRASHGYSISFSNTKECEMSCKDIASQYTDFKEEIGILFLCDSLGKTDIRIKAVSDEEIEKHENFIHKVLDERNLCPRLMAAIKQLPVNIAITKRYLQII